MPDPTPGWTPVSLASCLVAAWNPSDPAWVSNGALVQQGPGAWGASLPLACASLAPTLEQGFGPSDQNVLSFSRIAKQAMHFSDLPSGDLHIVMVVDFKSTSGDQVLLGHQSQTSPNIRLASNASGFATLCVRAKGGNGVNLPLPFKKAAGRFEVIELIYNAAAGTAAVVQDGKAGATVVVGNGGFGCNQLSGGKGANHLDGYVGPVLIFNRALTSQEAEELRAFLTPWCSKSFYLAQDGDDAARGDRPDRAWKSLNKIEQLGFKCRPGDSFILLGGMEVRRLSKFNLPISGTAAQPCTLKGQSPAMKASIVGSTLYEGGWTTNPDGTFSRTDLPQAPLMLWLSLPGDWAEPIVRRPVTTPFSFSYVAPVLTVALGPGQDINACQIEVASNATFSFYEGSREYWNFANLKIRHMPRDAFSPQGAKGICARHVDILYCANDGWGPGGGSQLLLEDFVIRGSGQFKTDNSASGDGISHHGNASGIVRRGVIEACMKAGIDDERGANVTYEDIVVENCNHNYRWLNQSSCNAQSGAQALTRVTIRRGANDFLDGAQIETGLIGTGYQFAATDCVITSTDPGPKRGAALNLASALVTLQTCKAEGFVSGLTGSAQMLMADLSVD